MREINKISIHISDSWWGDSTAIRAWHKQRGWSDIGYHFVILNGHIRNNLYTPSLNGSIDIGRPIELTPACVKGQNKGMIGICLIGVKGKFTAEQLMSAVRLSSDLIDMFELDIEDVKGHYEYPNVTKTCPDIDMNNFRKAIQLYRQKDLK